jgi:D-sedoheptulose 7-phosphate isomerase
VIDEEKLLAALVGAKESGAHVYLIGNGGSAANAMHIANDLFSAGVRAHALTDVATLTAVANDYGYLRVFEQQVKVFGEIDDILIALSGSGRSPNILMAIDAAEQIGMQVFTVTDYLERMTMQESEEKQVSLGHRLMLALRKMQ